MEKFRKGINVFLFLAFVSSITACASQNQTIQNAVPAASISQRTNTEELPPYIIQPGDQMDIRFFFNPELNDTVLVRPDGKISLQLIDEIQASGKTPAELDKALTGLYSKELRKPVITVILRSFQAQNAFVGGEVTQQGLINLSPGTTALQAVIQSGGFLATAKPQETIIIRKGADNRPIPIRINLASAMQGQTDTANFLLQPSDIVYVPKSGIAKANQFVNQYIERLFLFRGISFGFTHEVGSLRPSRW